MRRRRSLGFGLVACGVVGVLLPLQPAGASPVAAGAGTSASSAQCHDVYFVSVRGSGEAFKGAANLAVSPETQTVERGLAARLAAAGSTPDVVVHQLSYPAPSVDVLKEGLGTGSLAQRENRLFNHNLPLYLRQEQQGEQELEGYLKQVSTACATTSKQPEVVLAGYSQGALVIHNVLRYLVATGNSAAVSMIAASVLTADPERMESSSVLNFGTATSQPSSYGICIAPNHVGITFSCYPGSANAEVPAQFVASTVAVCDAGDLVCDAGATIADTINNWHKDYKAGIYIHTNCHDYCAASATTAGEFAANRLLKRGVGLTSLSVATTTLPTGTQGTNYLATLNAAGGVPPYGWTQTTGTLPPGISLAGDGTLSGTPSSAGTFAVGLQVQDSVGAVSATTLSISINPPANSLRIYRSSGPAGLVSGVARLTCPAPQPGNTMWVISEGAGQTNPDYAHAQPYVSATYSNLVYTSNDLSPGSYTATITCAENSSSSSPASATVDSSATFTQTITDVSSTIVVTPAPANGSLPQYTISSIGGCGPLTSGVPQNVNIGIYDTDGVAYGYEISGTTADGSGTWAPITISFSPKPAVSWTVSVYCANSDNGPESLYDYPAAIVPVP